MDSAYEEREVEEYWRQALADCDYAPFPALPRSVQQPVPDGVIEHRFPRPQEQLLGITTSTLIRAAWALVAGRMTDSDDVVFGVTVSDWSAPVVGLDEMTAPTIPTVPVRVKFARDQTVSEYLETVQRQATEMIPFEQAGLQRIAKIFPESWQACRFQTLLDIQMEENSSARDLLETCHDSSQRQWFHPYALMLELQLGADIKVTARFDARAIELWTVRKLLERLECVMGQLNGTGPEQMLTDIETATQWDIKEIWEWNSAVPAPVERCVQEMIHEQARALPSAPAVCAWDGELTYGKLDQLATRLAARLLGLGVGRDTLVPLCFEKSMWATVAMLGVLKAGGAFVFLDPSLPERRLQAIVQQVDASLALSSLSNQSLSSRLTQEVLIINSHFFEDQDDPASQRVNCSSSTSVIYVTFTSGSTGKPKGVMITHGNITSALYHQVDILGFTTKSRVFDFASYSFDISVNYALMTLATGGCLCVPSDQDRRNNVPGSIALLRANALVLTPSVAQFLSPEVMSGLQSMTFVGEALCVADVKRWWGKVRVLNRYGVSECAAASTINCSASSPEEAIHIGKSLGLVTWVVDPENHDCLFPPGCIGELLLEGPLVSRGYLNDPEKTATAFIEDPAWLLRGARGSPGRHGRLYKTGDLVRYNEDGSLTFIGRKDTQVKIRGQRVELGEVEHHMRRSLVDAADASVVVEVITPEGSSNPMLVAFVGLAQAADGIDEGVKAAMRKVTAGAEEKLAEVLPAYMIPSAYIPVSKMPMTATGKTDRRRLREIGGSLTLEQLAELNEPRAERRLPTTAAESQLQQLWAAVLGVEVDSIGVDDSFLRIGGDSVGAMRLVGAARDQGLSLTVADVFKQPRLSEQALLVNADGGVVGEGPLPFSLLNNGLDKDAGCSCAATLLGVGAAQIEDIFPCTPLQEGLLAMTAKRKGDYINRSVLELQDGVDVDRFRVAWEDVRATMPILRTRIIDLPGQGLVQVVANEQIEWLEGNDLAVFVDNDKQRQIGLGTTLSRHGLVSDRDREKTYFVWTMHHALYDGWSMPLMLDEVEKAYRRESREALVPFQAFVKHIASVDKGSARAYWQAQLAGSEATSFPALPTPTYQPVADSTLRHHVAELEWPRNDITASTAVRVAWSILAARYTGSSEVVFGATVTGRQAAVPGIERIAGPTITTVPVRVVLDWEQTVEQLQQQVQAQAVEMTAFEQLGLLAIRSISQDTKQGSQFQTLVVVQPTLRQDERRGDKGLFQLTASDADDTNGLNAFTTYAIMMVCELQARGMQLEISFDSKVVESKQVRRMAQQLECVLRQVCVEEQGLAKLQDIETTSPQDLRDIWRWNATVPEAVDACVHDLIAKRTAQQPDAPAICAWDGELTYRELDELSTRLAYQLVGLGVGPNVIVPLCFEKSMWTAVAMLAVMKAGGASVAMDSSQPEERLRSIVQQVEPIVVVSSAANEALAGRLSMATVLVVDAQHLPQIKGGNRGRATLPTVQPLDTLYIVFTSGSTGTPKGVIITHRNFSSAIHHQQAALGFNTTSRVFDFVSYAFDVTWSNLLHTLSVGGCLCVPSESDRYGNPEQSMVSLGVNYAHLTPTVGRLLNGSHIPLLSTLRLGGERMMGADVTRWKQQGTLLNTYGPAECTVTSTLESINQNKYGDPSIGRGSGCNTWVVDSRGHNQLVPVGSVGELVLEGPLVGGGYLSDPEKTAAAFVQDPPWLLKGEQGVGGRQGQLYRTGDLVRYSADGTLVFIGRKDAQVKIRGQRVELGEVEHHVQCSLVDAADASVVAEVITPEGSSNAILVAFVGLGEAADGGDDKAKAVMRRITAGAEEKLAEVLPAYMIPSAYIPINKVPMTATGKTDRRRLREIGGSLTLEQLAELNPCRGEQQQPSTAAEGQLQRLWAAVLGIAASSIGVDDSFFRIGGDSIAAMRLVGAAREQGLSLTVADVFKQPRLSEQALLVKISRTPYYDPKPFSLVSTEHELNHYLRLEISPYLDHPGETVLEVLPVTYFQAQYLSHSTDIVRLFDSCIKLWDSLDILRTVFIQGRHGYLQVVGKKVRPIIDVYETKGDLTKFSQTIYDEDFSSPLKLGKPFTRFLITHASDGQKRLTIRLSHAQYDGISLGQILSCLAACYDGREPPAIPKFAGYIKHDMIHRESARDYWRLFLHGSGITKIRPTAVTTRVHNKASLSGKEIKLKRTCPAPQCRNGLTPATLFTALIACALGRSTKSSDVVFGLLVSGRSMLPSGLQGAIGPCLNYIPIRVRFADDVTLDFALKYVEEQRLRGLQFETSQFTDIVRHCTDWPGPPKDFGVVVQYQNIEENRTADISGENSRLNVHEREQDIDTPVVSISATPVQGSWNLEVIASAKFHSQHDVETLLEELLALIASV
ncbi:Nonribosomal Peptide Synthase (NRPS) [Pseudogymnoascus sp. 23342-1-I1]|nr:Nonribosomal Peptide Synthase (NRPS) [Pseudogymnoascus sp. 23342-1-I1]